MKIWIDILTPKQLLFSESIIAKFGKKHKILCTSREYNEVTKLAKIRHFNLILVGKHAVPNIIENLLVKKGLVKRETNPKKISDYIKRVFESPNNTHQKRARKTVKQMDDPIQTLVKVMKD